MKKPIVTVIIPVYNGASFLEHTITSLIKQSFRDFEVLFVDDCSTDDSVNIIASASERDVRFRYLRTPTNLGIVPKVMNFARSHASGDFFVYSSQDDFFSDDWLLKMVSRAELTGADAVIPDLVFYTGCRDRDRKLIGVRGNRDAIISGREAFVLSLDWTIPGNALWRMNFLKNFGYFDFGMYADEYTARYFFLQCLDSSLKCDG